MKNMWLRPVPLMVNARRPTDIGDYNELLSVLHGRPTEVSGVQFWEVCSNAHLFVVREKRDAQDAEGGRMVGMLTLVTYSISEGPVGLIEEVAVLEEFARQGIADALTDEAIIWARALKCVRLELTSGKRRAAARKLYFKKGFVERKESGIFRLVL